MRLIFTIINTLGEVLSIAIIVYSFMSFIVPPYNPIRSGLGKVIEPLLDPVRKIVKPVNGIDFSPMVLLFLVYIARWIIIRILSFLV